MSNASRRWVKVWHEILNDTEFQNLSLEQQARYYGLLVFTSAQGEKGCVKFSSPAKRIVQLLQCEDFDHFIDVIKELPNLQIKVSSDNAKISVTFNKWSKYQVDSTSYERVKRFREAHNVTPKEEEKEKEEDKSKNKRKKKSKKPAQSDEEWLKALKENPAYKGMDIDRIKGKFEAWCMTNNQDPTRRRFVNWLNREDKPLEKGGKSYGAPKGKYDHL